jgi:hypothetical protein
MLFNCTCGNVLCPSSCHLTKKEHYQRSLEDVAFEVITTVAINSSICKDTTHCSAMKVDGRFGETCRLNFRAEKQAKQAERCGLHGSVLQICLKEHCILRRINSRDQEMVRDANLLVNTLEESTSNLERPKLPCLTICRFS